jgi:hypothetical protein
VSKQGQLAVLLRHTAGTAEKLRPCASSLAWMAMAVRAPRGSPSGLATTIAPAHHQDGRLAIRVHERTIADHVANRVPTVTAEVVLQRVAWAGPVWRARNARVRMVLVPAVVAEQHHPPVRHLRDAHFTGAVDEALLPRAKRLTAIIREPHDDVTVTTGVM